MQTSLRGIATKAKQNKDYKFGNLYGLLNKDALYQAFKDINKNSATDSLSPETMLLKAMPRLSSSSRSMFVVEVPHSPMYFRFEQASK